MSAMKLMGSIFGGKKKVEIFLFMFTDGCKTEGAWIILPQLMVL
jgi:hypothetical protein